MMKNDLMNESHRNTFDVQPLGTGHAAKLDEFSEKFDPAPRVTKTPSARQVVSNADRKVFANPESFCDKFIIG